MSKDDETIEDIVKNDICTGCGTCVALCPSEALELTINEKKGIYIPKLTEEKCNNCGICLKICPGHEIDFKALNLEIFKKEPDDVMIGNYLNCYIGHATDYDIRYNSASGGLITALLIFALEEGIIDGALVTRMKKDSPLEPEPFIARTKEEIIEASKSKYCPVPSNIAVKEISKSEEGEKFAVVGLSCHIHGIRKAEMINKELKEKIVLHLGILCNHTANFLGTEFLLQKFGVKKEDVKKLDYRGEGWPGGMLIEMKNGSKKFIPLLTYWISAFESYFIPTRCTLCSDETCELADISFGDIFSPELLAEDKIGTSVIISRNEIGDRILQNAKSKEKVALKEVSSDKVIQSQEGVLYSKKRKINARIFFFRLFGKKVPIYDQELLKARRIDYLGAIPFYFDLSISSKRYLWGFLRVYTPLKSYTKKILFGGAGYCLRKIKNILR